MRKFVFGLFVLVCMSGSVRAQEAPKYELFGGYSYGQLNPGGSLVNGSNPDGKHFALSGGHFAAQKKIFKNVGLVIDISGYAGTSDVELVPEHSRYTAFLAGPQLNVRKFGRMNIFVHGLVGVARDRVYLTTGSPTDDHSLTRLASAFGGGMDYTLTKHIALRAFDADYVLNSFSNGSAPGATFAGHQQNARISSGIVVRFGGR
jgi:outer membrane immunogenic protein